jgi:MYXO-CTERM domain-containing protein
VKRKRGASFARTDGSRAPITAASTTFRLPTIAAIASALALTALSFNASAIVGADTGTEDGGNDAELDADPNGAPDAPSCPPMLGGVPPPTRVHGSGCGCGSEGNESGTAALAASVAIAAIFVKRRR